MNITDTRIAVIGVGGVGGYIAGMLTRVFPKVTLCARGQRARSILENGLVLHSDLNGESVTKPYQVVEAADQIGQQDIIFVCVKNYSLEEVGRLLDQVVEKDTIIVPVMNGVDPGDRLRSFLHTGTVIDSLIYTVSYANADYSICQEGPFTDVKIGIMHASEEEKTKIQMAADVMKYAGISIECYEDIEAEIWKKYILNCAYNVLTAVYDNNLGQLRESPVKKQQIIDLVEEAYLTAITKGVHVQRENADFILRRLLIELDGSGTSSLQRDIVAGRKAELSTFGGYLVEEAERLGIDVPVSKEMYERLQKLSAN